jgi:hypothetical protein
MRYEQYDASTPEVASVPHESALWLFGCDMRLAHTCRRVHAAARTLHCTRVGGGRSFISHPCGCLVVDAMR